MVNWTLALAQELSIVRSNISHKQPLRAPACFANIQEWLFCVKLCKLSCHLTKASSSCGKYLQTQVTTDASRKHSSLHWTWYKLNEALRSEQIIAFILGNGKGKEKVMQCYGIKLRWLLTKKRKNTRLSGEKLVISFPTLDNFFVHPNREKATRSITTRVQKYHHKNSLTLWA